MKKKFAVLFGIILITAALLLTPATPLLSTGVKVLASQETATYTAPTQDATIFQQTTTAYDLSEWQKNTNDYLIATTVTHEINNTYHSNPTHKAITLDSEQLGNRNPYLLLANKMKTSGSLSLSEITFTANSFYAVEVDYQILGDENNQSYFYLGDSYLPLQKQGRWRTAAFLVQTDSLAGTTLPARLYLGTPTRDIYGAAYYYNFKVTALSITEFNRRKDNLATNADAKIDQMLLDFSNKTDVELVKTVANTDFTVPAGTPTNVTLSNNMINEDVPRYLNFTDKRDYFYTENGKGNIMLMAAKGNNATLTLDNYHFQPLPHEVYMFQFYSIMPSDLSQFYFRIGDTYQKIGSVNYTNHNGWQLNTVFYVAGHDAVQDFTLSFTLAGEGETSVTGWVALDALRIYRVSGDYATTYSDATGVQGVNDLNNADDWTITNGSFELGTATGKPTDKTYPYPLKANQWTTEQTDNGIVNTAFWYFDGITSPGVISDRYNVNNNLYMLRNTEVTENKVTSPSISTTVDATTYVSFDAYTTDTTPLYVSFQTTDGLELNRFVIKDNAWQHYELAITEHAKAATRSYQLVFTIKDSGTAYLDNFRSETKPYQFDSAETTTTQVIDLTSPVKLANLWQVTDSTPNGQLAINTDNNGITLRNEDQTTVTVQYALSYTLTANEYYRIRVTARGENAFLELKNFDGYLTVTTDDNDAETLMTYTLYCQAGDSSTTLNFLITLGSKEANTYQDGNIYLTDLTITDLTETDYNLATKNLGDRDKIVKLTETASDEPTTDDQEGDPNNFFGENWWYLIPTLITAIAILLAVIAFLWHRLKFDKHVTTKTTTYARDVKIKNAQKKIVAQKTAKVDNIKDETSNKN